MHSLRSRDPSRWTFTVPKCRQVKQRLTLASLGSPKTPANEGLLNGASEVRVGGRFW
ncbi:hypothetical protein TYRP_009728 [Tyrophagus putrescentiae]|nr:hypothetical protein TYRP_009728 [Tyrophagus putrescentiae]